MCQLFSWTQDRFRRVSVDEYRSLFHDADFKFPYLVVYYLDIVFNHDEVLTCTKY